MTRGRHRIPAGAIGVVLVVGVVLVPLAARLCAASAARLLLLPLLACMVIASTHSYLGIHVVRREIIFVDLAFAQLASLGAVFALLPWFSGAGLASPLCSLAFVCLGAVIFTVSRTKRALIPQEAIIGIVYAVSTAVGLVAADRIPEGLDRIKEVMVGRILWTGAAEIAWTSRVYAVIMVVHLLFFRRFSALSGGLAGDDEPGEVSRWWDLLFYLTFGAVVMRSVGIAGILLVFSFLIVPAVIAMMLSVRFGARLALAFAVSVGATVAGIALSYGLDLPAGPCIVCLLGLALALVSVYAAIAGAPTPWSTALKALGFAGSVAAVLGAVYAASPAFRGGPRIHAHELAGQGDPLHNQANGTHAEGSLAEHLIEHLARAGKDEKAPLVNELRLHTEDVIRLLESEDAKMRERAAQALAELGGTEPQLASPLAEAFSREPDPWVRLALARALLAADPAQGRKALEAILEDQVPLMVKAEAQRLLNNP